MAKTNEKHVDQYVKVYEYENELWKAMLDNIIHIMTRNQEFAKRKKKRYKSFYNILGLLREF